MNQQRSLSLIFLALAAGLAGGLAGGLVVFVAPGGRDATEEAVTPSPVATAATPEPTAVAVGSGERLQRAIERVLPAVVTVIADGVPQRDAQGGITQQRNVGSGIVIDDRGHVVTNFHVIDGAAQINVLLTTGEQRPALVRSHDSPYSDLAVLSVSPEGLRSAVLGDSSQLVPGEPVAAVSAAGFAIGNSVSVGVVSGTGREWPRNGVILEDLVQTDAAVNSGDSGGALINSDGEVVGLLTTVVRATGTGSPVQGISFAQSSNSLRPIIEDIVLLGAYVRPRLGIERPFRHHIELTPELSASQGIPLPLGALVIEVEPGSAAREAGIRIGDIVTAVNGVAIDLDHPFVNLLKPLQPGEPAELTVVRAGQQLSIAVMPRLE
ncbi:MAG: PDZ domain-containing protein [Chloroflexi bacterium]|nr:PDZ domain-containing protein [Chloroflexota bacterium]